MVMMTMTNRFLSWTPIIGPIFELTKWLHDPNAPLYLSDTKHPLRFIVSAVWHAISLGWILMFIGRINA